MTLFLGRSILTRSTHHAPYELAWSDVWDWDFRLLSWKRSLSAQSSLNWSMHVLCGAEGPPINCRSYAPAFLVEMERPYSPYKKIVWLSYSCHVLQDSLTQCTTLPNFSSPSIVFGVNDDVYAQAPLLTVLEHPVVSLLCATPGSQWKLRKSHSAR